MLENNPVMARVSPNVRVLRSTGVDSEVTDDREIVLVNGKTIIIIDVFIEYSIQTLPISIPVFFSNSTS